MMIRIPSTVFAVACFSLMIVSPALAERPSVNMLNARVNQLEAEVGQLQAENDELRAASLRVLDGNGSEVGPLVDRSEDTEGILLVYLPSVGGSTLLNPRSGLLEETATGNTAYFAGAGCTGQPYMASPSGAASRLVSPAIDGAERYFIGRNELAGAVPVQSVVNFGPAGVAACQDEATLTDPITVLADEVFLEDLGLSFPLALPIYIAPAQ